MDVCENIAGLRGYRRARGESQTVIELLILSCTEQGVVSNVDMDLVINEWKNVSKRRTSLYICRLLYLYIVYYIKSKKSNWYLFVYEYVY